MADARCARRHALLRVFLELVQVKIVAPVVDRRGAVERCLRYGEHAQPGRQRERLLRAGQQQVDAEPVELNLHARERANAVDDKHHVRILGLELGNLGERAHHAGGCFVVDECDGVERAGGQTLVDLFRQDGRAPLHLQCLSLLAAAFGHVEPLIGEGTLHAGEHALGHQVADRALHDAPSRRRAEKHQLLREEQCLQIWHHGSVQVFKVLAAMPDHRRAKRLKRLVADLYRPRYV